MSYAQGTVSPRLPKMSVGHVENESEPFLTFCEARDDDLDNIALDEVRYGRLREELYVYGVRSGPVLVKVAGHFPTEHVVFSRQGVLRLDLEGRHDQARTFEK